MASVQNRFLQPEQPPALRKIGSKINEQYRIVALPLCKQITKCLNSCNSQVAERALYVWNNEWFVKMALQAIDEVFPIVVQGMEKNLNRHWSKSVCQLTENVKEMLVEMEPNLYSKCLSQLDEEEMRRREMWDRVEEMATKMNQIIQDSTDVKVKIPR